MPEEMYKNGRYLIENPTWDAEHSVWKAEHIIRMMRRNNISAKTICEVGCGAGGILAALQKNMDRDCVFWGYDISPQALELCKAKTNANLHFKNQDILTEENPNFDLLLLIDVIEHMEDYFGFLRGIKNKSTYKILHIPLDISVQAILRVNPLIKNRVSVGHIHYFTKDTALMDLKEAGYEVMDYFYTASSLDFPHRTMINYLARLPREMLFRLNKDFAVRLLGGYSMMVLAK